MNKIIFIFIVSVIVLLNTLSFGIDDLRITLADKVVDVCNGADVKTNVTIVNPFKDRYIVNFQIDGSDASLFSVTKKKFVIGGEEQYTIDLVVQCNPSCTLISDVVSYSISFEDAPEKKNYAYVSLEQKNCKNDTPLIKKDTDQTRKGKNIFSRTSFRVIGIMAVLCFVCFFLIYFVYLKKPAPQYNSFMQIASSQYYDYPDFPQQKNTGYYDQRYY